MTASQLRHDHRHVREILKGLELERANHSATPCAMERKDEGKGSTDEDRDTSRLNTSGTTLTTVTTGTDCRWQMMMTSTAQHSQVVTSRGTEHSLHESVTCRKIDQISSLDRCRCVVCAMARPTMRDMERVKRIGRYLVGRPGARCWFRWQQSGELEAYSDADWGGDKATRRSVSAGVMGGGHCLKVWTKKQQVVSLSSVDSELYAAVKAASEGLGIQSITKDMGISCGLNLHLDTSATMCLVNRRGLGKAKHVDMQNLWIQEASKAGRFVTKKVGTNVNPADLMTKPLARPKIEQLMSIPSF